MKHKGASTPKQHKPGHDARVDLCFCHMLRHNQTGVAACNQVSTPAQTMDCNEPAEGIGEGIGEGIE